MKHIASPVPSANRTSPFQAALAAQIGVLTHLADRMERFRSAERGNPASAYVEGETAVIHSVTDALNTLYDTAGQSPAESPREAELRAVLSRLVHCSDLNLDNMDDETFLIVEEAKRLLYPDVS